MNRVGYFLRVSVIISTYAKERSQEVLGCIDSLKKQTLNPEEIILVLDPDKELKSFYDSIVPSDVVLLPSEERGLSKARNTGVRRSIGDVVAFIDDDAFADSDWLRNLVENYEQEDVLGVGGVTQPIWESGRPRSFPEELDWVVGCSYKGLPESGSCIRNPIGCNMSFRRKVFETIGYFESHLGRLGRKMLGSEEAEFSMRLLRGFPESRIIYDPSAVVYHKVPKNRQTLRYFVKRCFYEGVSKRLMSAFDLEGGIGLSFERHYLKYLLKVAIPSRIKQIHKWKNFLQLLMLLLSISLVLAGYLAATLSLLRINGRIGVSRK